MKFAVVLLASAALTGFVPAAAAGRSAAQRDTVDASLPTQLPRTAIPHHYALTVTPHAKTLTFHGQVGIDLEVIKSTNQITLNAADLRFTSATLRPAKVAEYGENTVGARSSGDLRAAATSSLVAAASSSDPRPWRS